MSAYWPPEGEEDSEGEADSVGDGDGELSEELFLDSEGDASDVDAFFLVEELELVPPAAFFVVEVEVDDFFVVAAVVECVVVAACSSWWVQATMKAVPATTAVKERSDFFIVKVNGSRC